MEGACGPRCELSVPLVVETGWAKSWDEAHYVDMGVAVRSVVHYCAVFCDGLADSNSAWRLAVFKSPEQHRCK
jgi:hypothetical protein